MKSFREYLRESEDKKEDYKKFFAKKLEKYGVKSPDELSDTDKKKFYDEVDAEWTCEKEEPEVDEKKSCNEANELNIDKSNIGKYIKDNVVLLYVGAGGTYRVFDIGDSVIQTYNKANRLIAEFVVYKEEFNIIKKYI